MTVSLRIQPEVARALYVGRPVVALESSVLAHGMPHPVNLRCARDAEGIIREHGALPATIAVLQGRIHVGLTHEQLHWLSRSSGIFKVNRRDLPAVLASGKAGATTVSASMVGAALAGIRVLVTGGIGGVHRGGESSLDVSADLAELARTEVAVVSAGVKSVLDIGRTLEVLESLGVPLIGYRTNRFPAFYCRDSGFEIEHRVDSPDQAVRVIRETWDLGLSCGVLIVNPVPESHALDPEEVQIHVQAAVAEAASRKVSGKPLTPFLLKSLVERTKGRSLEANLALIRHNAEVGAKIACVLQQPSHA